MSLERGASAPGIVVLSSALQVLHMNRRAMVLLTQLDRSAPHIATERAITAPLHRQCRDILETMQERQAAHNWQPFHHYRTIDDHAHPLLLKGFGLPDRRGLPHSRIVILLSPQPPVSMPGISTGKHPDGISKTERLGGDS